MNWAWRFTSGADRRWMWERLSEGGSVIAFSRATFESCEEAIADAQQHGYAHVPSQPKLRRVGMSG